MNTTNRNMVVCWWQVATFSLACCTTLLAQYPTVLDPLGAGFSGGLLNSPEVGYVEGIHRFGRQLRTDPDPGVGFTYRVFPRNQTDAGMDPEAFLWALVHFPEAWHLKSLYASLGEQLQERERAIANGQPTTTFDDTIRGLELDIAELQLSLQLSLGTRHSNDPFSRYASARNTTAGIRNPSSPKMRTGAPSSYDMATAGLSNDAYVSPLGFGIGDGTGSPAKGLLFTGDDPPETVLYNQPLVQIKVRIVEATRLNSTHFRSVLDYISREGINSQVNANSINVAGGSVRRSTRAATRLPTRNEVLTENQSSGTLSNINGGSGALINLTTEHLNLITNMLVTEFNGDVFTVPEVVTKNGQNVEFVAGENRPFPLGLALELNGEVKQEFFYKHVGTLLSVTPRIVNWGRHLEGAGEAPIVAQEIGNWNRLAAWMSDDRNIVIQPSNEVVSKQIRASLAQFGSTRLPVPIDMKAVMLEQLEQYPPVVLRDRFRQFDAHLLQQASRASFNQPADASDELPAPRPRIPNRPPELIHSSELPAPILRPPSGIACDWKPEDCTIDLEIVVRESSVTTGSAENKNSIANIVQVKSGHGVVMGGMIGTSEIQTVSKIPVLGDLPAVGYLFRSKSTDRARSELIILVEATVLPNSCQARAETARDFQLGHDYVSGDFHDIPLQAGMHRAGFGPYLPPSSVHEDEFWAEHGNNMRRVVTEIDDVFR